ncbi:MAG: hypothetical protein M3370_05020 [Actinomycetota bacterium]|nr:hypothetical protein [Actinomycetota bacterium]
MLRAASSPLAALARARRARAATTSAAHRAAVADGWRALWTSRLLVWCAGIGAVLAFGLSGRQAAFDPLGVTAHFGTVGDLLVAPAARWDAVWFLSVAEDGYVQGASEAFFPLYPALVAVAGALLGSAPAGGIAVSLGCLAVALYLLHRLTALDFGRAVAATTVTLLALSPAAFFLSAIYSESLFLALSVGAVLAARTDRWWAAGALGAVAACTRSAGVVLVVPLALMYLYGPRGARAWEAGARCVAARPRFPLRVDALAVGLVPLGLLAYCASLALSGQDPLAPFAAQAAWLRSFAGPFVGAWDGAVAAVQGARQLLSGTREPVLFTAAAGDPYAVAGHNLHLFAWLVAALVALAGAARRLPAAYTAYAAAALALPLSWPVSSQPLMSLPRFLLVLWPLWLWLALWVHGRPVRRRVVVALFAVGLVVSTGLFATWHWVA